MLKDIMVMTKFNMLLLSLTLSFFSCISAFGLAPSIGRPSTKSFVEMAWIIQTLGRPQNIANYAGTSVGLLTENLRGRKNGTNGSDGRTLREEFPFDDAYYNDICMLDINFRKQVLLLYLLSRRVSVASKLEKISLAAASAELCPSTFSGSAAIHASDLKSGGFAKDWDFEQF